MVATVNAFLEFFKKSLIIFFKSLNLSTYFGKLLENQNFTSSFQFVVIYSQYGNILTFFAGKRVRLAESNCNYGAFLTSVQEFRHTRFI